MRPQLCKVSIAPFSKPYYLAILSFHPWNFEQLQYVESPCVEKEEGLILGSKRRLETAHLPNRADRQNESNGLSLASIGLGHDPDILRHRCAFLVGKSI